MQEEARQPLTFWQTAFAVATGITLAAIASGLAALVVFHYGVKELEKSLRASSPSASLVEQQGAQAHGHWVTEIVGPQSKEACLVYTHNVVNEEYEKCRNGYRERKWIPDP